VLLKSTVQPIDGYNKRMDKMLRYLLLKNEACKLNIENCWQRLQANGASGIIFAGTSFTMILIVTIQYLLLYIL